jgi:hypothetical protein
LSVTIKPTKIVFFWSEINYWCAIPTETNSIIQIKSQSHH